jgi:hypothetical protein
MKTLQAGDQPALEVDLECLLSFVGEDLRDADDLLREKVLPGSASGRPKLIGFCAGTCCFAFTQAPVLRMCALH